MSELSHAKSKTPLLGDTAYKSLKQTSVMILPAIGTLYFALAQIWHLPNSEQVVGTIVAIDAFAGVVLGISTRSYNNSGARYAGEIHVHDDGEKRTANLVVDGDPEAILSMEEATFKMVDTGEHPIIQQP